MHCCHCLTSPIMLQNNEKLLLYGFKLCRASHRCWNFPFSCQSPVMAPRVPFQPWTHQGRIAQRPTGPALHQLHRQVPWNTSWAWQDNCLGEIQRSGSGLVKKRFAPMCRRCHVFVHLAIPELAQSWPGVSGWSYEAVCSPDCSSSFC